MRAHGLGHTQAVPAEAGQIAWTNVDGWRHAYVGILPDAVLEGSATPCFG
ncbi:MAG: hypothetical protein ACRDZO_14275 [Egibacteraceae bacterium]